jgi:hypothetical protein
MPLSGSHKKRAKKAGKSLKKKVDKEVDEVLGTSPMGAKEVPLEVVKLSEEFHKIWELRMLGNSVIEVAHLTQCSIERVNEVMAACMEARRKDIAEMAEANKIMDAEKIELLLRHWLPVATQTEIITPKTIGRDRQGDPIVVDVEDFDRPLKALYGVLALLERKSKLYGYENQERDPSQDIGNQLHAYLSGRSDKTKALASRN